MVSRESRYDEVAEWYEKFTRDWEWEPPRLIPTDVAGRRVLDMACGLGRTSQWLAAQGVQVVAVDLSQGMLARARPVHGASIQWILGDVSTTTWWDGTSFDGVLCHMALMDIDDMGAAFGTAARVLKGGGWLVFSLLHPCFPGWQVNGREAKSSWPPERGYSSEGWWTTNADGVRGHVGANHRTLSTYLNSAIQAGFEIEELEEPAAHVPRYLVVRCRQRNQ